MSAANAPLAATSRPPATTNSTRANVRRVQADAADPALPVRWRRPPGGEAPQALRGGAIYSPSPIWMYPVGQTSLQMWQPMHLL